MNLRWVKRDADALAELRSLVKNEIAARPQYPDVVGDRRLLRFIRGKQYNIQEAAQMYTAFLKWRDENNVDDIRNQILFGGLDSPYKFPNGKKIIDLAPQIIISAKAQDKQGQPLVLEQYSFSPADMLARVTIKEYLQFLIYSLEYRALVMEQLSHEREQQYLSAHPNPADCAEGYGVLLLMCCIRDLQGVGLSHLTGKGKAIIEAAINIGLPNYPEYLGKCHMINVPWVFTSMWYFIKGLLDEYILAKISFASSSYMDTLLKDIPLESIPKALGGKFHYYNESFAFDTSPTGPFHTEHKRRASFGSGGGPGNTCPPHATSLTATTATTTAVAEPAALSVEASSSHSAASLTPSPLSSHQAEETSSFIDRRTGHSAHSGHSAVQTTTGKDSTARGGSLSTFVDDKAPLVPTTQAPAESHGAIVSATRNTVDRAGSGSTLNSTHDATCADAVPGAVNKNIASTIINAVIESPVAACVGVLVLMLFLAAPWATVKYIIVPLLFALFVVYVI